MTTTRYCRYERERFPAGEFDLVAGAWVHRRPGSPDHLDSGETVDVVDGKLVVTAGSGIETPADAEVE